MKGFLKYGVLALVLVLVSGCGSTSKGKVLTCTMSENSEGMDMAMTMKATFENDKATKVTMDTKVTVDESMASYVDMLKSTFDAQFKAYAEKDGVKYSSKASGKTVSFTIEIDEKKVSKEDLEAMEMDGANGSYDEAKSSLETAGWSCK